MTPFFTRHQRVEFPPKILALGELLWDLLPDGKQVGGAPGNFAFHCGQLGAKTQIVSCIGDDPLGHEMLDFLREHDFDTSLIRVDPGGPTGTVTVELEGGIPRYTIVEDVAWDKIVADDAALQAASEADAICFGSLASRSPVSRKAIQDLIAATKSSAIRVFDVNLRAPFWSREQIAPLLEATDILKLNEEEMPIVATMFGCPESALLDQARWFVREFKYDVLILTMGAQGSRLMMVPTESRVIGQPVEVVDTVGAGDSFTAQVVVSILSGQSLDETHKRASRLSEFVCTQRGAMCRHDDALRARLAAP